MDELMKYVTPENFSMLLAIYLLVRFEKTIAKNSEVIDNLNDNLGAKINRTHDAIKMLVLCFTRMNGKFKEMFDNLMNESETVVK